MEKRAFAIVLSVLLIILMIDLSYIFYDRIKEDEPERIEVGDLVFIVTHPDKVDLSVTVDGRNRTNYSHWLEVEGAPNGSNITWLVEGIVVGEGNRYQHTFFESGILNVTASVTWHRFMKNESTMVLIQRCNHIGSSNWNYSSEYDEIFEVENYYDFIVNVKPGITDPTLLINISLISGKGHLHYWIRLMEENKMDYFRTLSHTYVDLDEGAHENSFYFDSRFFKEFESYEPYYFIFYFDLENGPSNYVLYELYHELIF